MSVELSSRDELPYWLALNHMPGFGARSFQHWLAHFKSAQILFKCPIEQLKSLGMPERWLSYIQKPNWSLVEKELQWSECGNHHILTQVDPEYPQVLREIASAPAVLYLKGNPRAIQMPQLAMVGSRNPTPGGQESAYAFARTLSQQGLTITSGLALGVDTQSHKGALAGGGKTVAVLGSGVEHIYPASNRRLAAQIVDTGAIVSEFSPWEAPKASHFPRRNRVISGLSFGVLVVEAALKSGSLITAQYAVEQGREVYAIPGSVHNPLAKGCHKMIKNGAKLVETVADIIEELQWLIPSLPNNRQKIDDSDGQSPLQEGLDPDYMTLIRAIGFEGASIDTIIARTEFSASAVTAMTTELEIQGLITSIPGGYARKGDKTHEH